MYSLTLQNAAGDSIITSGNILGRLNFAVPSESDGAAATYVVSQIYSISEGSFTSASNPAGLLFATSSADSAPATGRIKISSDGHFIPLASGTYDLGSPSLPFRNLYINSGNINYLNINSQYAFPTSTGSVGDSLVYAGSNQVSWSGVSVSLSGQLDGNLDLNGYDIVGTGNIIISGDITAQSGYFDVISFNIDNESILTKGQISWDDTEGTMDIGLTDNTSIHIGSHKYFRIRNSTGDTLYKGQAVYATGVHENGIIEPDKYVADGSIREVYFMGLMLEDVSNNSNGYAIDFGHLEEMDLDGSATNFAVGDETWNAGDILYVHPTGAGKLTKVEPKHSISVAIVLDPGNGNGNGRMFVRPTSYGHLSDNHDVNTSGLLDNQFLVYDSGTDYWQPSSGLYYVDGDLGIGTALPDGKLHIKSEIVDQYHLVLEDDSTSNIFRIGVGDTAGVISVDPTNTNASSNLQFHVDGSSKALFGTSTNFFYQPVSISASNNSVVVGNTSTVFNEDGNNIDFRVEGSGDPNLLFTNASTNKVGIGTASPSEKLDVSGGIGHVGWKTFRYIDTAGPNGSSNGFAIKLNDAHGTTLNTEYHYRIRLTTDATATTTGATYLVWYKQATSSWEYRVVSWAGSTSNHCLLAISGSNAIAYTNHPSTSYDINCVIESYHTSNQYSLLHSMGSDYQWQRYVDTLYYNDGNVGVGTIASVTSRFQVEGGDVTFNDNGGTYNFRVEGDADQNLLFVQGAGGHDNVAIGTNTPLDTTKFQIQNQGSTAKLYSQIIGGNNKGFGLLNNQSVIETLSSVNGFYSYMSSSTNGAVTDMYHFRVDPPSGVGTITSQRGFYVGDGLQYATNNYGFYGYVPAGTNNYNIYMGGSAKNYFNGDVGIGTPSPSYKLDIRYPAGGGMALIKDSDSNDGLLFGDMAYSTSDAYQGIKHVGMTGSSDYMLLSEGTNTLMSAKGTAGKVYIRGGGNYGSNQILVYGSSGYTENAAIELDAVAGKEIVVNQQQRNVDFRVESNTDEYLLFTDASTDRVGINTSDPQEKLSVTSLQADIVGFHGNATGPVASGDLQSLVIRNSNDSLITEHYENTDNTSTKVLKNLIRYGADFVSIDDAYDTGLGTTFYPKFKVNTDTGAITFNDQFTFPTTDGSADQVLVTNGSGALTWQDQQGAASSSNYIYSLIFR